MASLKIPYDSVKVNEAKVPLILKLIDPNGVPIPGPGVIVGLEVAEGIGVGVLDSVGVGVNFVGVYMLEAD